MFFAIDPNNGVAIYEQIVRQVKFAVAEGILRPGQLLPSVRGLSQELAINPNTIARAFQQLQADGAVESLRGRGLAVRADAAPRCIKARRELIAVRVRSTLAEARHAGFSDEEIRAIVDGQLAELTLHAATITTGQTNDTELKAVEPSHA